MNDSHCNCAACRTHDAAGMARVIVMTLRELKVKVGGWSDTPPAALEYLDAVIKLLVEEHDAMVLDELRLRVLQMLQPPESETPEPTSAPNLDLN